MNRTDLFAQAIQLRQNLLNEWEQNRANMNSPQIICISWQSDVMPVPSFNLYHEECYKREPPSFPNQTMRNVELDKIPSGAVCCGCWKKLELLKRLKRSNE